MGVIEWDLIREWSEGNNKVDLEQYLREKWIGEYGNFDVGKFDIWIEDEGRNMIEFIERFIDFGR